jgi:hypothetical protein
MRQYVRGRRETHSDAVAELELMLERSMPRRAISMAQVVAQDAVEDLSATVWY